MLREIDAPSKPHSNPQERIIEMFYQLLLTPINVKRPLSKS